MRVAVIGAGSWGTTVASLVAARTPTLLWARRSDLARTITESRENPDYLPGMALPDMLEATADLERVASCDVIFMAVPSHGFREVLRTLPLSADQPIISLTKGIEQQTLKRMTEVVGEVLPGHDSVRIGVLTGPNLAREVMAGWPAAAVVAMADPDTAARIQELVMGPTFRVYTNPDLVGCETAGALKNVMAIASGMSAGMGFGDNTRATLITRALAELTRLGVAMGGNEMTFAGLAGMGDLIATCVSAHSRNHQVGRALAEGKVLSEIIADMKMVAEGVKSTRAVLALADRHKVEMPIAHQVGRVLYDDAPPGEALLDLMTRSARSE
ncbi:NAD(P)H-dependent glycerol-3-phosphate dehydrogenase [soil metagenome]